MYLVKRMPMQHLEWLLLMPKSIDSETGCREKKIPRQQGKSAQNPCRRGCDPDGLHIQIFEV